MSLVGYGSKIWKARRCRLTVSNETILETKQELFFTKVAPLQSIIDIALSILVNTAPLNVYFILNTIYFIVNIFFQMFIFH